MNAFDRNTNIQIIEQIRNLESISIDGFIENILIPLKEKNPAFCEVLYKDIVYVLDEIDQEDDDDLVIENGDFAIENGDLKLTGYQTRLHDIVIWLHMEYLDKIIKETRNHDFTLIGNAIEKKEKEFLLNFRFTPEYKAQLDKIRASLKKERRTNYENPKKGLSKFLDPDILELKPNIMGIGFNLNQIINLLRSK
jgi:hypothetical protein